VLAFILQHLPEHSPAAIQHGLRHSRLCKLSTAHVSYNDVLISIHHLAAELVQSVFAAVCCPPVQVLDPAPMAATLSQGNLPLNAAVEGAGCAPITITSDRHVLQPEINPDVFVGRNGLNDPHQ